MFTLDSLLRKEDVDELCRQIDGISFISAKFVGNLIFNCWGKTNICAMVKSRNIGDKLIPPFNRNPYNGYINPYYWADDHPLLYGNNGSLDPGTYVILGFVF